MGHDGRSYDASGPEALTHTELAEHISNVLGRRVEYVGIPPHVMRKALLGISFPVWQAIGLIEDYAHRRRGEASTAASGVGQRSGGC